ncbi:hypothetical protein M569_03091 [Genlisea aurea]|uniref:Uncharacterized protein n=1 Tax=Genlisea aurea TaxID=192259 RepID=S8E745_9LAMI|nr:hypothetical protein M569_03091 [Genlisea aurea]
MPFQARIQPIDSILGDAVKPPVLKSRLKRLFDRPFNGVLKASAAEKPTVERDEFEPSTVCLDRMVRNFIEDGNDKPAAVPTAKCGLNRCNCFNGIGNDSSDDELESFADSLTPTSSFTDLSDTLLKSLIPCASVGERNLLADTSKIVEKNNKAKGDLRRSVADGLQSLGYDASVCRSKWEKTPSVPAGEYEYIDVIIEGERVIVDVDFRSEFEIARSTSSYKAILQILPQVFVGKSDRLLQIVSVATEAARQSLKKKGMHMAPWRRPEYVKSKWLGPHTRSTPTTLPPPPPSPLPAAVKDETEWELIFPESAPTSTWQPPAAKAKGNKAVVTGLASLLNEKKQ